MNGPSPAIRGLSRRLLALEAVRDGPPVAGGSVVRVYEKLRLPLARLAGADGFRSLLSRALALAKAEVPSLEAIQVLPDGSLAGFDKPERDEDMGGVVLVAQLLGLLVTFIGEPLTLRLVLDAWPTASVTDFGREGR